MSKETELFRFAITYDKPDLVVVKMRGTHKTPLSCLDTPEELVRFTDRKEAAAALKYEKWKQNGGKIVAPPRG